MALKNAINNLINTSSLQELEALLESLKESHPEGIGLKFLVCDDKDFDGVSIAYILVNRIRKIFPYAKLSIINNNKHGIFKEDLKQYRDYDVIFIGDSSTNLVGEYSSLKAKVVVIDHHEVTIDLKTVPSNVILINSKMVPELECVSAGALAYILCRAIPLLSENVDSLLLIAVASCYSDIVPVDTTVIDLINLAQEDTSDEVICKINTYNKSITKTTLQYNIIPTINYSRRLQDTSVLKSIIMGKFNPLILSKLEDNKKLAMRLLKRMQDCIETYIQGKYENFTFVDITQMQNEYEFAPYPIENFKGVLANRLSEKYQKPVIIGFTEYDLFKISVRSNNMDSLSFFEKYNLLGGGHKPACGFSIPVQYLTQILNNYDKYCATNKVDTSKYQVIEIKNINSILEQSIFEDALYNEYSFSNRKAVVYKVNHLPNQIESIRDDQGGFTYQNIHFYTRLDLQEHTPYYLIPTLTAFKLKRTVLNIIECKEDTNGKKGTVSTN